MLVRQAANVLDLLEFFATRGEAASLAEVSRHFGWPRSSTFNLLSTLAERGFLYEPAKRGGFYPTPRWLALAQEISEAEPLPETFLQILRDLSETTGETVWIAAPSGVHAVFLEVAQSRHAIRYMAEIGKRVPLHATASGQAMLSQMPPGQRAALLRKADYAQYASGSPMRREAVEASMARALERGWFQSASGFSQDLGGVAVPLVDAGRIFALAVAGPLFRVEDRLAQIAAEIRRVVCAHLGADYFDPIFAADRAQRR